MEIITKSNLDELHDSGKCVIEHTLADNIIAHISLKREEDQVNIRGYLISQNPRKKIPDINQMTAISKSETLLPYDVRNVCTTLMRRLDLARMPSITRERHTKSFAERVFAVPDIYNPDNFAPYVKKGWGKTTTDQAVKYYANTIGKVYEQYGEEATKTDFETFRDREVEKIYQAKYQRPCKDGVVIKHRREEIYNGVNTRFYQAAAVQKFLLQNYAELGWPTERIPITAHCIMASKEEIKTISYEQYIKMCTLEKRLCEAGVAYAYASLGEIICGLRIGESCAPLIGDFDLWDGYGRYYVAHQIDENGRRTDVLKNTASYRYVSFGTFLCDMIQLRRMQLHDKGFAEDEMALIPLGSKSEAPHNFMSKSKTSSFVRKLLTLVGCDDAWLTKEAERMFVASIAAGNRDDVDVGAHELRSTLATLLGNGGVDVNTLDAILGHTNEKNAKIDYASCESAERISRMVERAINLGSLCATRNPAISPVHVSDTCSFQMAGNTSYNFHTTEDMYVEIDVESLECGDAIQLLLPANSTAKDLLRRTPLDMIESKRIRPILPVHPASKKIEQWISEAYGIDLSDIISRYGEK